MKEAYRYACPECGSRQVMFRRNGARCDKNGCQASEIDPIDLKKASHE